MSQVDFDELAPWTVLHLFVAVTESTDAASVEVALKACQSAGNQVVVAAMLGHRADLCVMALGPNEPALRELQTALRLAHCALCYSYVSRTEVSEYAPELPKERLAVRLHPLLPPAEMPAFCFYPMSKRRDATDNWYLLDFESRRAYMAGHGALGRTFHGRVLQLITGSTGLDDYEWGVTLFGRSSDDLKACVYEMRFDEASARYVQFGPFLYGTVSAPADALRAVGLDW